jgi:hypothetical protein
VSTASLAREVERLKARRLLRRRDIPSDPVEFARECGIAPDSWQTKLLRSGSERILINASRQSGKSTVTAVLALHQALHYGGSLVLILAPALRQSQELFAKLDTFHAALGYPRKLYGERRLSLELNNGSRVVTLPGSERTVRGYSGVDLLIVDEASRVDDGLYYAIKPMLAVSGGRLMMLSTPYGRRGVFYEEWTGGEGWEKYEVPAPQCPRISPTFLASERKSMPEWYFLQEYHCRFMETEDQLFTHAMIEGARADDLDEYRFEGDENLWS